MGGRAWLGRARSFAAVAGTARKPGSLGAVRRGAVSYDRPEARHGGRWRNQSTALPGRRRPGESASRQARSLERASEQAQGVDGRRPLARRQAWNDGCPRRARGGALMPRVKLSDDDDAPDIIRVAPTDGCGSTLMVRPQPHRRPRPWRRCSPGSLTSRTCLHWSTELVGLDAGGGERRGRCGANYHKYQPTRADVLARHEADRAESTGRRNNRTTFQTESTRNPLVPVLVPYPYLSPPHPSPSGGQGACG